MNIKNYKIKFNVSALILFALIMLPNIIWFFIPIQNDVLKNESCVPVLDVFSMVFQVIMLAALCILKNKHADKIKFTVLIILSTVFAGLYYFCWILYFSGIVHGAVLIGLSLFQCGSFFLYGLDRKNYIALCPLAVFTVLHLISTVKNFL